MKARVIVLGILMILGGISLSGAEHGASTTDQCGWLLAHRTKEMASLNAQAPEVRDGATPEQVTQDTANWLRWRAKKQEQYDKLVSHCRKP